MNRKSVNNKLIPRYVITVFSDKDNDTFYLEQRTVYNSDGKTAFSAPVALTKDAMEGISKSYLKNHSSELTLDGYVAPHLIYGVNRIGKSAVIWYRTAMRRNLNFSSSLKINDAVNVAIPATLFVLFNSNLYLFSLENNERPDLKTKLFNAPFFNIYNDGRVCLGSAPIGRKTQTFAGEAERYETGFFMAEQNHGNTEGCKTALSKLWPLLIKAKADEFPKEEMKQAKFKTLGDLITKLIGSNNGDTFEEEDHTEEVGIQIMG